MQEQHALIDTAYAKRIHRATAFVTFAVFIFFLFFQINKGEPFRNINPFGEDPYDAIGSFAVQIALLIGVLTYARALRLRDEPAQANKTRLLLRGNALVLFAIGATLIADTLAEILSSAASTYWGDVLRIELGAMFVLALICGVVVSVAFRRIPSIAAPRDLTPADGIDDLWTLVRVPVSKAAAILPQAFVARVQRFNSDRLFANMRWLDPRRHPWRFACTMGLLVGVTITLIQLQEGSPNPATVLLLATIFISGEFIATLLGFAILGGYLGLRPSLTRPHDLAQR